MAKPPKPRFGSNSPVPTSKLSALADLAEYAANPPCCIVTRVATQPITSAAPNTITFDTEVIDTNGMFSPSSTTITATDAGVYQVSFWFEMAANTTGMRSAEILQNGTIIHSLAVPPPSSFTSRLSIGTLTVAALGDNWTCIAFQNSGSALNATARFTAVRVSGT